MLRIAIAISTLSIVFLGCGKQDDGSSSGQAAKPASAAKCSVEIQKTPGAGDEIKVNGTGANPAEAEADAWTKAGEAAPAEAADQLKDEARWRKSLVQGTMSLNDQVTHNANLKLTRVTPVVKGEATGANTDEACAAASKKACEAAGAGADCVQSGAYNEVSVRGEGGSR